MKLYASLLVKHNIYWKKKLYELYRLAFRLNYIFNLNHQTITHLSYILYCYFIYSLIQNEIVINCTAQQKTFYSCIYFIIWLIWLLHCRKRNISVLLNFINSAVLLSKIIYSYQSELYLLPMCKMKKDAQHIETTLFLELWSNIDCFQ